MRLFFDGWRRRKGAPTWAGLMNQNSVLCRFLAEHPHDWAARLTEDYSIRIKREGDLAIFNYGFACNFADPIVQEARGIILDVKRLEVVCWPFRKFGNHNESYADEIDWSSARVLEKIDGSIVKLWYDHAAGHWQFSTNGTIRAEQALLDASPGLCFGDVIRRAHNFEDIPFDKLDRTSTYLFELVSPDTQIVVRYPETVLYHIGTRSNLTGLEREEDIGIQKPASYPLDSLEACLRAAAELNREAISRAPDVLEREGFVVVDGRWNRVKVKSPDYLMQHRLRQIEGISKRTCVDLLLHDRAHAEEICKFNPQLVPTFRYYDFKLAELIWQAEQLARLAANLLYEYSGDRGAVAKILLRHRLSAIAFRSLDTGRRGGELLLEYPPEKLAALIPDYLPEDLSALFLSGGESGQ